MRVCHIAPDYDVNYIREHSSLKNYVGSIKFLTRLVVVLTVVILAVFVRVIL